MGVVTAFIFALLGALFPVVVLALVLRLLLFIAPARPAVQLLAGLLRDMWIALLYRAAGRERHPLMTLEDYEWLREWETGEGLELTEVPAELQPAVSPGDIREAHERLMPPEPAVSRADVERRRQERLASRELKQAHARWEAEKKGLPVVAHPYLPGECTHPADRQVHTYTEEDLMLLSSWCSVCGATIPGGDPFAFHEGQMLASMSVPPVQLGQPQPGGVWRTTDGGEAVPPPQAHSDPETVKHLAQLAPLGLLACISPCMICMGAGRQPIIADQADDIASAQAWLNQERWDGQQ